MKSFALAVHENMLWEKVGCEDWFTTLTCTNGWLPWPIIVSELKNAIWVETLEVDQAWALLKSFLLQSFEIFLLICISVCLHSLKFYFLDKTMYIFGRALTLGPRIYMITNHHWSINVQSYSFILSVSFIEPKQWFHLEYLPLCSNIISTNRFA